MIFEEQPRNLYPSMIEVCLTKIKGRIRRRHRQKLGSGIFKCDSCKKYFSREKVEIHHIDYTIFGKWQVLCKPCHAEKTKKIRR